MRQKKILADTLIDTTTGDDSYSSFSLNQIKPHQKAMAKNLRLQDTPQILDNGPRGERNGVFWTGKSELVTRGISMWYHFAGVKYDFDAECETLSVTFSYLNNRHTPVGKVVVIIQQVDMDNNIIWEEYMVVSGYKDYVVGWETLTFAPHRFETRIAGRTFNRVWLVEAELFKDTVENTGGYFDDIAITVTFPDPVIEEPVVDRELPAPELPPIVEPEPDITHEEPITDDWLVDDAVEAIQEICSLEDENGDIKMWKSHGTYVACIAEARNTLRDYYDKHILDKAVTVAAQSDIGRKADNIRANARNNKLKKLLGIDNKGKGKKKRDMDDVYTEDFLADN